MSAITSRSRSERPAPGPPCRGLIAAIVFVVWGVAAPALATPWPGDRGVEIGRIGRPGGLLRGREPSGAAWHERLGVLLVVSDTGSVSRLDAAGGNVTTWLVGGDLEAISVADPQSNLVYIGREDPDAVLEFDLATGLRTENSWDLTPWMTGPASQGLEALTYADGLFYAGHQGEGKVYVFRLAAGGVVEPIDTFAVDGGRDDLSGLDYDANTDILYAIYDSSDVIVEMRRDGSVIREFDLPGKSQEGVAVVSNCDTRESRVFISDDPKGVWRYEHYPAACPAAGGVPARSGPGALGAVLSLGALAGIARMLRGRSRAGAPGGCLLTAGRALWSVPRNTAGGRRGTRCPWKPSKRS